MRTFLLIAALATAAAPAAAATRNFGITSFTKVRVDGPYKVKLSTGVAPFASATGSPAALDRIAVEVRGDTLVVHSSLDSWGGYPGKDVGPVEISLGTHDLSSAILNGSGTLSIDERGFPTAHRINRHQTRRRTMRAAFPSASARPTSPMPRARG